MKKILIAVVALIAVYLILALVGPSGYRVERQTKIGASVDVIFDQTTVYSNWAAWSPWAKLDPNAKYEIKDDNQAVGASMSWDGNPENVGKGQMVTTKIEENKTFVYQITFISPWEMTSNGGFIYEQDGDSVLLTWYDEGEFGFFARPMMLFMSVEDQIAPSFEQGLADIKQICESMKKAPEVEIVETEVTAQPILFINEKVLLTSDDVAAKIGAAYGEIGALMGIAGVEMTAAPLAITNSFSMEEMSWDFDCAIVAAMPEGTELSGRIQSGTTYAGKVVRATHVGPYDQSVATYNAIEAYMKEKGLEENGRSWEEYVDDPSKVSPEELKTYIYFPVK
ncbi:MAG: GyrI-like domain-containing protein [Flavobacteriales bacterium]|nr:GyrI-like domain-containing protein [Flavobacteriales bacterium]